MRYHSEEPGVPGESPREGADASVVARSFGGPLGKVRDG